MKRIAVFIAICLLLSGCQAITFSVDGLLNAPNVADEQSAIYQALIESAGRGINLEYPRNGDYRSAFVSYDIDSDSEEEILAFYSVGSVSDSNVKISVLDSTEGGGWRSTYELAGAGSAVERVMFSGRDIIVGYSAQEYEENALRMYRYSDGVLAPIYEGTYTVVESADLDGCGEDELAIVRRSGLGVVVEILKPNSDGGYNEYDSELETGASAISGYCLGELGGKTALYLDMSVDDGSLVTEIFCLTSEGISCPISGNGLGGLTRRPAGYISRDYDGDGRVEMPSVTPFIGYDSAPWGEAEYMTALYRFSEESLLLEFGSNAYFNIRDGYMLTIPSRWLNMVTVLRDDATGEVTFVKYDSSKESIAEMEPIISFAVSDVSGTEAFTEAGYKTLKIAEDKSYYYKIKADPSEPLVLTTDEIRDNFHITD